MKKRYSILILLFWISNITFSQDFEFKWQVWPSFSKAYTIKIERKDSKSYIQIKETISNDSIRKKISNADCDTLIAFLDGYKFMTKGSTVYGPKCREYFPAIMLSDTNWILVRDGRDSVRRELMWLDGYSFDSDSNKFYKEVQMMETWTDGNTYRGEYIKLNTKKIYSVHSARISAQDFKLNKMIYHLIIKYDKKHNYSQLKKLIDSDKPREN